MNYYDDLRFRPSNIAKMFLKKCNQQLFNRTIVFIIDLQFVQVEIYIESIHSMYQYCYDSIIEMIYFSNGSACVSTHIVQIRKAKGISCQTMHARYIATGTSSQQNVQEQQVVHKATCRFVNIVEQVEMSQNRSKYY